MAVGARFVLLGEATHGSHELYRERARITQRLISEQGFNGVVVEADWPDADRANRWAQGRSDDESAEAALGGFRRFPTWMWRNTVVVDFLSWLRAHNEAAQRAPTVFHGMDLYNLYASMDAVVKYLERHDPAAAERARARYACFEMPGTGDGGEGYGQATRFGAMEPCEEQAVQQLVELQRRSAGTLDPDLFSAEQNARLAR
ncbi:MAG: erythromycin esterase family protein, partial [Deltaproteobacteria bacterium]